MAYSKEQLRAIKNITKKRKKKIREREMKRRNSGVQSKLCF